MYQVALPGQKRRADFGLRVHRLHCLSVSLQLLDVVSHTPIEVDKLGRLQHAARFVDAVRHFVPADQKLYSWWSYRARDWQLADRGRRLDHVWVTPELAPNLRTYEILKAARGWEQPSDHVPVIVELDA